MRSTGRSGRRSSARPRRASPWYGASRRARARSRASSSRSRSPSSSSPRRAHRYLYRLIHRLADHGNQVFFTTHSPGLLNVAALEEVNLVTRDELGVTAVERLRPIDVDDAFRVMCEFDAERGRAVLLARGDPRRGHDREARAPVRLPRARPRRGPGADLDRRVRRQVEPAALRRDLQAGARPVRRHPRQRHAPRPRRPSSRSCG